MIEATSARVFTEIEGRAADLTNQFTPGYVPADDSERLTDAVRATRSLDPMSTVAPPATYYIGEDSQGRRFYSRDSALRLDDGALHTRDGSAILGFPAGTTGDEPVPLAADPVDVALGRVGEPHVDASGDVAYTRNAVDPKTAEIKPEQIVIGRIALARFPAGTQIDAADGVHITAPAGVEPHIGRPGEGDFAKLIAQSTDQGQIDMFKGLTHLRDAYLAFSALQTASHARNKTDKVSMDLIK
ncbi:MAG: hypothetical protein ACREM6_12020 [Vulcanimicrobiaceae bacterium]